MGTRGDDEFAQHVIVLWVPGAGGVLVVQVVAGEHRTVHVK